MKQSLWLFIGIVLLSHPAQARKFDFKTESFAPYVRGTYGPSEMKTQAFGESSGTNTSFDSRARVNYSGEAGFILASQYLNFRGGVEFLIPEGLSGVRGTNAAGVELFRLKSQVQAIIPMAAIEFVPVRTSTFKALLGGGMGYAFTKMENTYTMTPTGTTQLGVGSFVEGARQNVIMWQLFAGLEFLFTDTVTMMLDGGYRSLVVAGMKHDRAATTIVGNVSEGDQVKNASGANRRLDLSGPFIGLSLRFYIGL